MRNEYRQLAGLVAEDRLRWLSNFLADEPQWDRRMLLRLGAWATTAVGALVIAMLSVHWTADVRREQLVALELARQSQNLEAAAHQAQAENRRLTAAIETLNSDRDRLYARVTVLEQGLDSLTGAVTKQTLPASMVLLSATVPITLPPPVIAAPAVMPAHVSDPVATPQEPDPPAAKAASPAPTAQWPAQQPAAQAPAARSPAEPQRQPLPPAALYAPPDPAASQLVETAPAAPTTPERRDKVSDRNAASGTKPEARKDAQPDPKAQLAAAPPAATQPAAPAAAGAPAAVAEAEPEVPAPRTDFGVDLGGANSLDGLRGLWQGLLKADPSLLSPLRPIVVIRERTTGLGLQLRLVAGPLTDAAAAARICAALAENDRSCETTVFDGQRLALKAQTSPVAPARDLVPTSPPPARTLPHTSTHGNKHAAARPTRREEHAPEPAPAAAAPATTQSTSSSVLPEFLRGR